MLKELLEEIQIDKDGYYIDATYGRGGHSLALLEYLSGKGRLIAYDKDLDAAQHARALANDKRFEFRHASYARMSDLLKDTTMRSRFAGIFFDLGVSSPQLDSSKRGFSFSKEGPLDMRMDTTRGTTAADWLNQANAEEIKQVLRVYGEEPKAKKIAQAIIARRPLRTTTQLVQVVRDVGATTRHHHPATRTFLALRLFINHELEELSEALDSVVELLRSGGRLAVIAFHSLEDRIVKRFIKSHSAPRPLARDLPLKSDDYSHVQLKKIGRLIRPSDAEIERNPRARSARLRVVEKL